LPGFLRAGGGIRNRPGIKLGHLAEL
jgi:hypothetical protein